MKKSQNLFKQRIKEYSTQEQKPFAGLKEDLRNQYKTKTATGNDMMSMLHDIVSGAESDSLDGLKTRLVRLDKMSEFLIQSDLDGQEQQTVFKAHTKVQSAVRKRKDQYDKKHKMLKDMLSDVGSGAVATLDALGNEIPQIRMMMVAGRFIFNHVKKARDERKQKLEQRQQELKRDAETFYARELQRGSLKTSEKNKLKRTKSDPSSKFDGMDYGMMHDSMDGSYGLSGRKGVGLRQRSPEAVILTEIASDIKIIANYYKGKLVRDKDARMDDLEAMRESSRLKLSKTENILGKESDGEGSSGFISNIIQTALGMSLGGALIRGLKGLPKLIKNLPGKIKAIPGMLKSGRGAILSGLGKVDDFLRPDNLTKLPGKALDWVKSVPGKGLSGISGAEDIAKNVPLRDPKTGRFVARNAAETGTKTLAKQGGKAGVKATLGKIPVLGAILGAGFAAGRALEGDWTGAGMELASGAASTLPGLGTGASFGIDAALVARDMGAFDKTSLNPFSITEANAAVNSPQEINKKKLVQDTINAQVKQDPSTMPSAIVPIAKLAKTGDLKELLQGDSNGLGFIFSLKNIDTKDLLAAMVGSLGGASGGASMGSGASGGTTMSGAMGNPTTGSSVSGAASLVGSGGGPIPIGPAPAPGQGANALSSTAKFLKDQRMETANTSGLGRVACVWATNQVFNKAGIPLPWDKSNNSVSTAEAGLKRNGWTPVQENDRRPGDVWVANNGSRRHIGIVGEDGNILNNSSNNGAFTNNMPPNALRRHWGQGQYYRMPKGWVESGGKPGGDPAAPDPVGIPSPKLQKEQESKTPSSTAAALGKQESASNNFGAGAATPAAVPVTNMLGESAGTKPPGQAPGALGDDKQFAREDAITRWHESNDPNKGTPEQFLKREGLLGDTTSSTPKGTEGIDWVKDPDNGEIYLKNPDTGDLQLADDQPRMSEARQTVTEKSSTTSAQQNQYSTPVNNTTVVNNNNNTPAESSSNSGSGTRRWSDSFGIAADIAD